MKRVYLCFTRTGSYEQDEARANEICAGAATLGVTSVVAHPLLAELIADPKEFDQTISFPLLGGCDELWICEATLTHHMAQLVDRARRMGMPVRRFCAVQRLLSQPIYEYNPYFRIQGQAVAIPPASVIISTHSV